MNTIDELFQLFAQHGEQAYFGEAVTELEHALQCARLAEHTGAPATLIVAALLHDVGHLLHGMGEDIAQRGIDARHEDVGAAWLRPRFATAVVDPVRLHVAAKRYLCAVEPAYLTTLSPSSQLSLGLQGGPMSAAEVVAFEHEPHYRAAVAIRRWDDEAKVQGWCVPPLAHYRGYLEELLQENNS